MPTRPRRPRPRPRRPRRPRRPTRPTPGAVEAMSEITVMTDARHERVEDSTFETPQGSPRILVPETPESHVDLRAEVVALRAENRALRIEISKLQAYKELLTQPQ